jgi:hypothetical protein
MHGSRRLRCPEGAGTPRGPRPRRGPTGPREKMAGGRRAPHSPAGHDGNTEADNDQQPHRQDHKARETDAGHQEPYGRRDGQDGANSDPQHPDHEEPPGSVWWPRMNRVPVVSLGMTKLACWPGA